MGTRPSEIITRWALRLIVCLLLVTAFVLCMSLRKACAWGDVPARAQQYRSLVIRSVRIEGGMAAPVALFAAQLAQESGWNPEAVSPVGARGLAQFMPATAKDMGRVRPDMGPALPTNPAWAVRALVAYDMQNKKRIKAASDFDLWAMTLSAYNGGLGWVYRDQAKAKAQGMDPAFWWDSVETVNAGRVPAAWHENRGYPKRIMLILMPVYESGGWGQGVKR